MRIKSINQYQTNHSNGITVVIMTVTYDTGEREFLQFATEGKGQAQQIINYIYEYWITKRNVTESLKGVVNLLLAAIERK